jgi:hypothetical protein
MSSFGCIADSQTKLSRYSPISMTRVASTVCAGVALFSVIAMGTMFLRDRSTHIGSTATSVRPRVRPIMLPGDMELQSKKLAGPTAVDCGRVLLRGDPQIASECALTAQRAGMPFRVRYDLQGIDSLVAAGIVRDQAGNVQILMWDSDPSGGGRVGPGVVFLIRCPVPVHLWVDPNGRVKCLPKPNSSSKDPMYQDVDPY